MVRSTNDLVRYFDLFSGQRTTDARAFSGSSKAPPSIGWQISLYAALLAGVICKDWLEPLGGTVDTPIDLTRLFAALVAATIAFPGAYKAAMEDSGPGLVQLCIIFTAGIGVKTVVDSPA